MLDQWFCRDKEGQ